jgi:hypothetical protein
LLPIGTTHKVVKMQPREEKFLFTVAPQTCQSFTVVWHADFANLTRGEMRAFTNACEMNEVDIYDKKCTSEDPTPVNLKVIRNELDELHLEVKCPKAGIVTISLGFVNNDMSQSKLANISIVEGLISSMFTNSINSILMTCRKLSI